MSGYVSVRRSKILHCGRCNSGLPLVRLTYLFRLNMLSTGRFTPDPTHFQGDPVWFLNRAHFDPGTGLVSKSDLVRPRSSCVSKSRAPAGFEVRPGSVFKSDSIRRGLVSGPGPEKEMLHVGKPNTGKLRSWDPRGPPPTS